MNPSFAFRRGLAAARLIKGISFSDLRYDADLESWCLYITCQQSVGNCKFIPDETSWVAVISDRYPKGSIEIFPSIQHGITHTFQHQEYNSVTEKRDWRSGKICVSGPLRHWGRKQFGNEPSSSNEKLEWHLQRAGEWIRKGRLDRLVEFGDPFELPDLCNSVNTPIAFNESAETMAAWSTVKGKRGTVDIATLPFKDAKHCVCIQYRTNKGEKIDVEWGVALRKTVPHQKAYWIMLPGVPVNPPWQLPATWHELANILNKFGFDAVQLVHRTIHAGAEALMLGFPIPKKVGEEPERIHWFAVQIPSIERSNGFIPGSEAHIRHVLRRKNQCNWIKTENWSLKDVTSRSKLDKAMTTKKILFIGGGSVGSITSELFCRMGCADVSIMDREPPTVSNLSRHTLTMEELHLYKAEGIAKRLNAMMPYVDAKAIPVSLEKKLKENPSFLKAFDVIVDITAEDDVLELVEANTTSEQHFISLSTGFKAMRSYFYTGTGGQGLVEQFLNLITPFLDSEVRDPEEELEFEGAGCWHPLFPARYDDILTVISPCIRNIEQTIITGNRDPRMTMIEQTFDGNGNFTGTKSSILTNDSLHNRSVA